MAEKRVSLRTRKFKTKSYILNALDALRPPEKLTVSEWAEKHRILDSKTSARPGPWQNSSTPYLKGVMDELNNYNTEEIVFVKPTQVGGTEAIINMLGYVICQDPAPAMIVYPTDELATSISKNRLNPMIVNSPAVRKHYKELESSKLELQFDDMYLSLVGSNSPSGLASKPIRFLFLDEVDKFPGASKKEADPVSLAKERTKTFHNRKIVMASTPTLKSNHIWEALEDADIEKHYFMPCPYCGQYIEFKFSNLKFPDEELSNADRASRAFYSCQECGCVINDRDKQVMLQRGEWRTVRQNTTLTKKVAFWMNTLYSPFVRFSEVALEFLDSKKDSEKFQNFVNSWLAEPWEDTNLKTSVDLVMKRQTELPETVVPEWAKMLVGGVDVQENCLYFSIRAFGDYITSQNILHRQVLSFQDIESYMNLEYEKTSGEKMVVDLCLVDSGFNTDATYDFCANNSDWALPVKGSSGSMSSHYKLSKVNRLNSKFDGIDLVLVDGGKYKDMIAGRMKKENGSGSWMVHKDCDEEYAQQVTAEHKVNVKTNNGREKTEWRLKKSHGDNHYLDTEVYCLAAADLLGVRSLHLQTEEQSKPKNDIQQEEPEESWIKQNESWL